ncbi:MAG: ABC transporter substrate-binding protein [Vicinamibacterales bacterium]
MYGTAIVCASLVLLVACAPAPQDPPPARPDLAPTGTLRAGLNFGNVLLTGKDPATGEPRGVAVDLARELARRLDVPLQIVPYESAGALADAVKSRAWDVAFLGAEPQRASEINFTAAYVEIESTYLVPPGSPLRTVADVDRDGARIAVSEKSAYDLYLSRNLQHARLERAEGVEGAFKRLVGEKMDALAGLRPVLLTYVEKLPGSRVLDDRFTTVQQAVGTPKDRDAGAAYLREFIEDVKAAGLVAQFIESNGVRGLTVAPPATPQ